MSFFKSSGAVTQEERGLLFEGMVAQLLRAYKDYRAICDELTYWAPSAGTKTEVDFLLLRAKELIAIEVKSGPTFSETWGKGQRAMAQLKGLRHRIIVYPKGPALRTKDGIDVLPFQHFADRLAANALL